MRRGRSLAVESNSGEGRPGPVALQNACGIRAPGKNCRPHDVERSAVPVVGYKAPDAKPAYRRIRRPQQCPAIRTSLSRPGAISMATQVRVAVLIGSLRKESFSRKLALALIAIGSE